MMTYPISNDIWHEKYCGGPSKGGYAHHFVAAYSVADISAKYLREAVAPEKA